MREQRVGLANGRAGKRIATPQLLAAFCRLALACQVAITGSTKGLGLALAESFLELGDDVVRPALKLTALPRQVAASSNPGRAT